MSHDRGVFKPQCWGEWFQLRSPPHTHTDAFHPTQMAHFNNANNANFNPTPSTSGGLYAYPHLSQTLATETEGASDPTHAGHWSMVRRPGPMIESPTSIRATASSGECHSNWFVGWRLMRGPQTQWLRPPHTRPEPMTMIGHRTIGQRTTNTSDLVGPVSRAGIVPLPGRRRRNHPLRCRPPVAVSIYCPSLKGLGTY